MQIEIEAKTNKMEAVVLNNLISESALNFSIGPTTNPDPEKLERIKLKHLTNTDPTRSFQGGNILGLFSLVSKLFKNNEEKKRLSKLEKRIRFERFKVSFMKEIGTSFFTDDLKIPYSETDKFLLFCNKKQSLYDMYTKNEKLDLLDFFIKQSDVYNEKYDLGK